MFRRPACTATATEISYHDKDTLEADVSIVTEEEWKAELGKLQWDLWNPEANAIRPASELSDDSEVTLSKVCVWSFTNRSRLCGYVGRVPREGIWQGLRWYIEG